MFNPLEPILPLLDSGIGPILSSNTGFGAVYNPFQWYVTDNQIMSNGSTTSANAGANKSFRIDNFVPYPYLGVQMFGTPGNNWTAGKIQIFLYYKTV